MKTSLAYLPQSKRDELGFVVEMMREGFARSLAHRTAPHIRAGHIHKIILFGSYARGDWVEDQRGRYFSDFDLLVVVSHEQLTDVVEFWLDVENELLSAQSAGTRLRTLVNPIYHSLDDLNTQLAEGRYFFTEIVADGIVLYDDGAVLVTPKNLTKEEAHAHALGYYRHWFESAADFEENANHNHQRKKVKLAAFNLHQAVERYYHTVLLVFTLHSPKTHVLTKLRDMAEARCPELRPVWPRALKADRRRFEKLKRAYIDARYSPAFDISNEELVWLSERVAALGKAIDAICRAHLGLEATDTAAVDGPSAQSTLPD